MNPIKNKKDLETIIYEIRNFAHAYLEKYSPSKQQLRIYLFKKILKVNQKKSHKKELFDLIDVVISSRSWHPETMIEHSPDTVVR